MLDFMIIALPRSGTTWAANWLTCDRAFCVHDPLWTLHYNEIDEAIPRRASGRLTGISCTALWRWPTWLNAHPARKVILHRDLAEVRAALAEAGVPATLNGAEALDHIAGRHVSWTDLFAPDRAADIWHWLTGGMPFDGERHAQLVQLEIQPKMEAVQRDMDLNRRLAEELGVKPIKASDSLALRFGGRS